MLWLMWQEERPTEQKEPPLQRLVYSFTWIQDLGLPDKMGDFYLLNLAVLLGLFGLWHMLNYLAGTPQELGHSQCSPQEKISGRDQGQGIQKLRITWKTCLTYTFSGPTTDPTKLDSPTASPQNLSFCNNSNIIMVIDSHWILGALCILFAHYLI